MIESKRSAILGGVVALAGALMATAGCFPTDDQGLTVPGGADGVGMIVLMLTTTPADVRCVRVALDDTDGSSKLFSTTPGRSATLTFDGVAPGMVQVTEEAFNIACGDVRSGTVPTWVTAMPVSATVVAGQSTAVAIVLHPAGSLTISNDFEPAGGLTVSPSTVDFGSVVVGSASAAVTVTVKNTGPSTTGTIRAALSGAAAAEMAVTNRCTTLATGASCTVALTFRPASAGAKAASLTVSASPGGQASVALAGVALSPAVLTIVPGEIDFGSVAAGAVSAAASFSIRNTGQAPAAGMTDTLAAITVGGVAFRFAFDTCAGTTLAPGEACSVSLVANPARGVASRTVQTATLSVTPSSGVSAQALLRLTVL